MPQLNNGNVNKKKKINKIKNKKREKNSWTPQSKV